MKRNNFKIAIIALATAFSFVACEDYLDVNDNPNGPSAPDLVPEIVLPAAQARPYQLLATNMNQLGNTMIATWSGNAQQIQTPFSEEFQYQITPEFYPEIWDRLYIRTANLTQLINFESSANYDNYKAAAMILKSFYLQYAVDLYGDCPYTEAGIRGDNLFPNYDNQEDIYRLLVDQVDDAIALIDNTDSSTAIALGGNDVMLGGDMDRWKRFGHTVKLRLLVRLMNLATVDAATDTYIQSEMATLNAPGVEFLAQDATINPGYSDEATRMNPFAELFGFDPGQFNNPAGATTSNTTVGPTVFLVDHLNNTNDTRLDELYATRPGQATITGNTQGGNVAQPSRLGPGLLKAPNQDGYIMTLAESFFLQAEAAQRGYLNGVNAQTAYESGITASFAMLDSADSPSAYYGQNINLVGWNASTDKIEAIITQKWIALGGTNGIETWIEYSRTGFPSNMPLTDTTPRPSRPVR